MNQTIYIIPLCSMLSVGCQSPGNSPQKEAAATKKGQQPKSAPPAKAPDTVSPAGEPAHKTVTPYDSAKDPANAMAGGFSFTTRRDPSAAHDAKKQPFSIEALYGIRNASEVALSPDGTQILFSLTDYELSKGKSNKDIYLIGIDGKRLRRMTRDAKADFAPRWAIDGRSFFFVATRNKGPQLWRMPIDGGEPEQLTTLSTGVGDVVVSPSGRHVAFSSRVYPEYGADDAKNKALDEDVKKSPVKAHIADELLYRHWTAYLDGKRSHIFVMDLESKKIIDVTPGDFESPALFVSHGFAFSPDGKELCFVSNREENASARSWTTNKDLFVVPTAGGKTINITAKNKAFDGHPSYAPDGSAIAYLRQAQPGYEADHLQLALYDRKTGKTRLLSAGFDNWALGFHWAPDSRSIVFRAAEKGRFPLFRIDLKTGTVKRLALPGVRSWDLGPDGALAFTNHAMDRPLELFTAKPDGTKAKRLTHFNKSIAQRYDLRPMEELWIEGAAGKKVHVFLIKPHGFKKGKRYPLVINVHGGPQYQWADTFRGDYQIYPGSGYIVAAFNPHGSIGYGQAYTAAISKDWGGKVYQDVMKVTEALSQLPFVAKKRIGAMGWSYGGYMMAWLLGHTKRFAAISAMMPVYDLRSFYGATEELWFPEWDLGGTPWANKRAYEKWSPSSYAENFATPTLVITGEKDYRVPYTQGLQLFTALRRQNVPAKLIVFANDGHWPSYAKSMPLYYAAHLHWFAKYLGGKGSPYDLKQLARGRAFKENAKPTKP